MVPLHVQSAYSLCRGPALPDRLIERACALGHDALALTDVNGLYGSTVFHHAAVDAGIRPIVGADLRDGATSLVALVIDRAGYENLCRWITRIHCESGIVDGLHELSSAPVARAEPSQSSRGNPSSGLHLATADVSLASALLANGACADRLWLSLDPAVQGRGRVRHLQDAAEALGVGLLATASALLADTNDLSTARLLAAIRTGATVRSIADDDLPHPSAVLRSPTELARQYADFPAAVAANQRVAEECRYAICPREPVFPKFDCPDGLSPRDTLRRLCHEGLRHRYGPHIDRARPRLERELELIERRGFSEYFLVVRDIVNYALGRGVPIAGRGSGASSLVAYVLRITNVCPLELDIPFERFLNERREDFPDLDIDFCWRIRDEVIDYAVGRWGADRAAMVCTHNTFQPRSAFRETAKAMGLSEAQVSTLMRSGRNGPGRRIAGMSRRIVGLPHLLSVHPGGVVLGRKNIDHYAPIQTAAKGVRITQFDKDGVEDVGLVKLDLLGNRSLSTIRYAMEMVNQGAVNPSGAVVCREAATTCDSQHNPEHNKNMVAPLRPSTLLGTCSANHGTQLSNHGTPRLTIDSLPRDDTATFDLLCRADTVGCNQLESPAMRHLLRAMQPRSLRDIMKALALIRPGAASIGMKDAFLRRQRGLEPVPDVHPAVDDILGQTHGVMLYEDDVMLVAEALAGCDRATADRFRKAVQKCHNDEQRIALSREFLGWCRRNGVDDACAKDLWVQMAKFNAYSFCRAHAASYARLAYAVAYLKTHHPRAFWTSALNNNQSMYHPRVYVQQARRVGIRFALPDVNRSDEQFRLETDGTIRAGLGCLAGLGPTGVATILAARRHGPFASLTDLLDRTHLGVDETRAMALCGALDGLGSSRAELMLERTLWRPGRKRARAAPQPTLLATRPALTGVLDDYDDARKRRDERTVLGLDLFVHPLEAFRAGPAGDVTADSITLRRRLGRRVRIAGVLEAVRTTEASNGKSVRFFTFDDEHGLFEATAFAETCRYEGQPTGEPPPAIVIGRVEDHFGNLTLMAERVEWIED